jgi:FkbM family methyltransferase
VPFESCVAYGARSRFHAQVLRAAIRDGRLSREQAEAVTHDGAALSELLGEYNRASVPVRFRTAGEQAPLDEPVLREPFAVRTSVGNFRVLVSNERELQSIAFLEPDLVRWLETKLDGESVLYDIGANVGIYSLYAARRAPGARVVAFEPHPINHAALVHNVVLNRFDNVLPFPIALSDRTGVTTFGCSFLDSGSAGHTGVGAHQGGARGTRMDFTTEAVFGGVSFALDEFVRSATFLKPPTHVKIDVDGPELAVVRGGLRTLGGSTVRHVFVETGSKAEAEEIASLLEDPGFRHVGGNRTAGNQVFER